MAKVTMYYKSYCPYCKRAKALFDDLGQKVEMIDIEGNDTLRNEMIDKANGRTTVPQIFVDKTHVGGCDDLLAADANGKLESLLSK